MLTQKIIKTIMKCSKLNRFALTIKILSRSMNKKIKVKIKYIKSYGKIIKIKEILNAIKTMMISIIYLNQLEIL
jgi:hypothetical protein